MAEVAEKFDLAKVAEMAISPISSISPCKKTYDQVGKVDQPGANLVKMVKLVMQIFA